MDGVLIDSEPLWQRAEIEIFPDVGIELTPELCRRTMGLRIDEVVDHWYEISPWESPSKEELGRRVVRRVGQLIATEGELMPHVLEALDFTGGRARLGLASSSYRELIDAVLDRFDLSRHFQVVHSAEDEPRGKPDPGIYLTAAAELGSPPEHCLAIEDSPNGVLAAKGAGMLCIAVPDAAAAGDERFRRADAVIGSLDEVNETLWTKLQRVRR